jgi:uncharacterized protein DUF6882
MLRTILSALLAGLGLVACRGESSFDHYVHEACEQLQERQDQLAKDYKLGKWERYDWDQEREELIFSQGGVPKVIAKVQFVGSYSKVSNTWLWAWANDTVLPGMKMDVARVRQLGTKMGWERLTNPQWPATERDGWDMTGVALRVLDAKGAYRSPDEHGLTFMVITSIRWATSPAGGS